MLSVRGKSTGFDRAVYEGFNAALKRRSKAPFEFLNVDAIFEEVRREAKEYGDVVWKRLEAESIVGGREDFEAIASGSTQARERFARTWLKYKGRDAADAGIDPRWSEGLSRMAEHAKAQGFGGIVLMIDEFLLWLAEKSGQEFVQEINNLNVIVDHNTGQRPRADLRLRRATAEPAGVLPGPRRREQDPRAPRPPRQAVRDHQAAGRRAAPHRARPRAAPEEPERGAGGRRARSSERHQKVLPALLAGADIDYLRDVYPFHPALIEMLVDVTSLMQRERSALRLLYELLVIHYPKLPLGEFLPVGSAFAAIFPESGVEASKKVELMQDIHHQYYSRLAPAMLKMAEEAGSEFNEERRRALDQLVKTVLLAEVSPRLKQGGLTIERLVQLNAVDVEGETFRGQVRVAETDLLALSQRVPDLQVAGTGQDRARPLRARARQPRRGARARAVEGRQPGAAVQGVLGRAEAGARARGHQGLRGRRHQRGRLGPRRGDARKRRGRIKLGNVREMSYDDFAPPEGAFKVLVDYPWDEPGHTVDEDRLRATNVRKKQGLLHTVCWLPRHMSPTELGVLTELAAVRYLLSDAGQEDLLETLGPQDKSKILDQAGIRQKTLEGQLEELLKEVYVRHGEFFALISDVDSSRPRETLGENLEHIATLLMDRRYPQHPTFLAEPKKQDLEALLDWMVQAGETNVSVAYDENVGKVLKTLGQPLELVNLGQTKASLRLDSRYIKDVLQRADQDSVAWTPIADHLRETYGFQPLVVDLFLCFLCQRDHRALAGARRRAGRGSHRHAADDACAAPARQAGERGRLAPASRPRQPALRGAAPTGTPLAPGAGPLRERARAPADRAKRTVLQGLHARLVHLGVESGDRLKELSTANTRLGAAGADDDRQPQGADRAARCVARRRLGRDARRSSQQAETLRDALGELNEHARSEPQGGRSARRDRRRGAGPPERARRSPRRGAGRAAADEGLGRDLEQEGAGADQAAHRAAAAARTSAAAAAPDRRRRRSSPARGAPQGAREPERRRRHFELPGPGAQGARRAGQQEHQRRPRPRGGL